MLSSLHVAPSTLTMNPAGVSSIKGEIQGGSEGET